MARRSLLVALPWLAGLVTLGQLARGARRAPSTAHHQPEVYARAKLGLLQRRYADPRVREALARWGPRLWPGVPTTALVGLSASSTGAGEQGAVRGWINVSRATRDALAGSSRAREALGRDLPGEERAWTEDLEGQTWAGLVNLRDELYQVDRALPASLQGSAAVHASPWTLRLAVAGYSLGVGTTSRVLRALPGLGTVPEGERWAELGVRVADRCSSPRASVGGVPCRGRWQAAHLVLRVEQRLASGRLLAAREAPGDLAWYDLPLPPDVAGYLARLV